MNFKLWLIKEDLNFFDSLTPEKYLQMLMADPRGKKFIENIKTATGPNSLLRILDDPLGLYEKATQKPVDKNTQETYNKKMESEFIPFLDQLKNQNIITTFPDFPWFFIENSIENPELQQKVIPNDLKNAPLEQQMQYYKNDKEGGFRDSKKKIYFSFDITGPNTIPAMKEITIYFTKNPEFFRQAKFPLDAKRTESYIFYLSKIGDNYETKIQNDINSILSKLNLKANTKSKEDLGNMSGNELEVSKLSTKALLPMVPPQQLKILAEFMRKSFEGNFYKKDMTFFKKSPYYPLYNIIVTDPKLKDLFAKQGINIDLQSPTKDSPQNNEKNPAQQQPSQASGNLTLIPQETNRPIPVKIDAVLGNAVIATPNAQKFMSQRQFILKKVNNAWTIAQSPEAKNSTNVNGKPIGFNPQPLNNGDTITLGKTNQVPVKVAFN